MLRRRFRCRIAIVFWLVAGSLFLWWSCALTPLQRWYFWPYLNCALQGNDLGFYSEIHWLYKTAPRRKQELATDEDVISSADKRGDSLPITLSATARNAGWTGLLRGEEEWIEIRRLQPFLRQEFYGGQSLSRMLLTPVLWSIAALLALLAVENVFRSLWTSKRRVWIIQGEPSPSLFTRCAQTMHTLRSVSASLTTAMARLKTRTPAVKSTTAAAGKLPEKSIQASIPLFGASTRSPGGKHIWKPGERDRLM